MVDFPAFIDICEHSKNIWIYINSDNPLECCHINGRDSDGGEITVILIDQTQFKISIVDIEESIVSKNTLFLLSESVSFKIELRDRDNIEECNI